MTKKGKLYAAGLFYILWLVLIVLLCLVDRQPAAAGDTMIGLAAVNGMFRQILNDGAGLRLGVYQLTEYLGYFSLLIAACFALLYSRSMSTSSCLGSSAFSSDFGRSMRDFMTIS